MSLQVPVIPSSVADALQNPASRGQCVHEQMQSVIYWMACEGYSEEAIWRVMNASPNGYALDPEIPHGEIRRLIEGALKKANSGYIPTTSSASVASGDVPMRKDKVTPEQIAKWKANAEEFIEQKGGFVEIEDLMDASPIQPSPITPTLSLFETLYKDEELIAVQTEGFSESDKWKSVKDWRSELRLGKRLTGANGAWFRPNPVNSVPTGNNKTFTDADVAVVRYAFLENDFLPLNYQASLFAHLPFAIHAITDSAGKSLHAIVRLDGIDDKRRREYATSLTKTLWNRFGYDHSNHNPSKYTRLAGAFRDVGRRENHNGEQRLIYLAKDRKDEPII